MSGTIRTVRRESLRYTVGGVCYVVGALMLVAPHRLAPATHAIFQPNLPWWGVALLVAGMGMIATTVLTVDRPLVSAGHVVAGVVLVLLALELGGGGAFTAAVTYGVLGIGTAVAPFLSSAPLVGDVDLDLLDLTVAATAALLGGDLLAGPGGGAHGFRTELGLAFLVGASALAAAIVYPSSRALVWAAHLAVGAAYVAFLALVALPLRAGTVIAYYGAVGGVVAVLPWLAPRLRRIDPSSLRTRLTLLLVAVASLPLLLGASVIADRVEQVTIARELRGETTLAGTMARATGDAIRSYEGAVSSIADRLDVASLPASQQQVLLRSFIATDVSAFSTFDASGRPIARSDDRPLAPLPSALIDDIRRRNAASVFIATAPRTHAPEFIFAAPARAPSGTVVGFVGAEVEASRLIAAVSRLDPDQGPNSAVFVVDASGRVIAGPAGSVTQPSSAPPALSAVAARLRSQSPVALRVQSAGRDQLIGFAPVPEPGWGVLVEHPTAAVLESTYTLRDLAFLFLLLVVVVAAISGAVLAHYFVAPLRGLGVAVDRMAAGDLGAPLPTSGISELGHLAGEFRRMRDQIAARTMERERAEAEREQALAREREARRQAEAAVRVRDEFLSIAAHELKTPMASLRLWVQFLQRHAEQGSEISPTHLQRALRMVDQQVVRISDLVVQLLEVSRLQLGGFVLKRSVADVSSLVDEAVQLAQVRTTRHELRLTAPAEAWALVDAIRLSQVITNLLDNAIKYSPNGGLIDVALEATGADALRLSVRDRGIGIPPEHRPHVFDLFYQAHAESHRSGMGIGLYVSRQIVELHGGQITLLDPEDGGAGIQAIVYLPSRLDAAAEARAEPHPRPSVRTA